MKFCAVHCGIAHEADTAVELAMSVCEYVKFDNRQLTYKLRGCEPTTLHSYGDSFTNEQMVKDGCRCVIYRLVNNGSIRLYYSKF